MPRTKSRAKLGLRVWKDNSVNAPEWTMTADELRESWDACPFSNVEKMSAPDAPGRVAHGPWGPYSVGLHIVVCMGLYFDGEGGKFSHFYDWEFDR